MSLDLHRAAPRRAPTSIEMTLRPPSRCLQVPSRPPSRMVAHSRWRSRDTPTEQSTEVEIYMCHLDGGRGDSSTSIENSRRRSNGYLDLRREFSTVPPDLRRESSTVISTSIETSRRSPPTSVEKSKYFSTEVGGSGSTSGIRGGDGATSIGFARRQRCGRPSSAPAPSLPPVRAPRRPDTSTCSEHSLSCWAGFV